MNGVGFAEKAIYKENRLKAPFILSPSAVEDRTHRYNLTSLIPQEMYTEAKATALGLRLPKDYWISVISVRTFSPAITIYTPCMSLPPKWILNI